MTGAGRPTRTIILVRENSSILPNPTAVPTTVTAERWLQWAGAFFAVAVVLHNGDHVRRGSDAVSTDVFWIGNLAIALEVMLVVLVFQRHRLAALAALSGGAGLAVGYLVVHFLPRRSWLSDSFASAVDVSPLSWIAASVELLSAVTLAAAAWLVVTQRGGLSHAAPVTGTQHLGGRLHPVALAFAVSQTVTVVISFVQLS